ncbi:MAG: tetratricopeptide repeat protein [Myxococcota bacterium]
MSVETTSSIAAATRASGVSRDDAWLFGPGVDVWFGYGLAYILSVPLLVAASSWSSGQDAGWLAPALALFVSTPHYGATLLRVYERRTDRRRYAFFAVWVTLAMGACFVASLYTALLGSILLTVYLTWSPWHFSGQNYGIFLMYLRRAGVDPGPSLRRPIYAFFVASALLAILTMHVAAAGWSFAANSLDASGTFRMLTLGIPAEVASVAAGLTAVVWAACLGAVAWRLRPLLPTGRQGPLLVLVAMQALWYLPSLAVLTGLFDVRRGGLAFTAVWVATAHAVQYLWVTYYYARREGRHRGFAGFYARTWLAGGLLSAPILLLAPALGGALAPNTAGVIVLTIAALNIHHFILDGAIWKLRDGRVARVLLRPEAAGIAPAASEGRRRLRPLPVFVWTLAVASLGTQVVLAVLALPPRALSVVAEGLDLVGPGAPQLFARVGLALEESGRDREAIAAYERVLERDSRPRPWVASRLTWLLLEHDAGDPAALERAADLARYLVEAFGDARPEGYQTLSTVHARAGRWDQAIAAARRALGIARRTGNRRAAREIERGLERYRRAVAASEAGDVAP